MKNQILLVEDDQNFGDVLSAYLELNEYEVTLANDGMKGWNTFQNGKFDIISSIACFYDIEDPIDFMRNIHRVLADDGIWIFEQSYLPTMIETNSFDTVCHEHLEFYCLKQIQFMAQKVGFQIVDVEFNNTRQNREVCESYRLDHAEEKNFDYRIDEKINSAIKNIDTLKLIEESHMN
jgi:CheY-like chemotaxis protein